MNLTKGLNSKTKYYKECVFKCLQLKTTIYIIGANGV